MYHYTECGLRNVVLRDGYKEIETPYGTAVQIDNIEGLHQAISLHLIQQPFLSGREFRFLRIEMDMTQRDIGLYFGVGAQAVALWEKTAHVPRKADQMIRALYKDIPARQIANVLDEVAPERFVQHFHITDRDNWRGQSAN